MANPSRSASRPAAPQFAPGERFLTVGVVAEYFGVTEVTIKNWVDAGQLHAARTVGGHRRIAASSVVKLLEQQGRPIPAALGRRKPLVVLVDSDATFGRNVRRAVGQRCRIESASDVYTGLLMASRLRPELVVLDLHIDASDAKKVIGALRADPQTKTTDVIALGSGPADAKLVAGLSPSPPTRGSGSLTYARRSDMSGVVEAITNRVDRAPTLARARR